MCGRCLKAKPSPSLSMCNVPSGGSQHTAWQRQVTSATRLHIQLPPTPVFLNQPQDQKRNALPYSSVRGRTRPRNAAVSQRADVLLGIGDRGPSPLTSGCRAAQGGHRQGARVIKESEAQGQKRTSHALREASEVVKE